jgi:hypothetical protein
MSKDIPGKWNLKARRVAIFISDKAYFKPKLSKDAKTVTLYL